MNRLATLFGGRSAPFLAAMVTLLCALAVGFRGFNEMGIHWLRGDWQPLWGDFGGPIQALSSSPGATGWGQFGLAIACAALCAGLVFHAARGMAGAIAGWLAVAILVTTSAWMGVFLTASPSSLLAPLVLGVVLAWNAAIPWWARSLVAAPLATVAFLLWPGALVVVALLLVVDLLRSWNSDEAPSVGLTGPPRLPLDRFTTLIAAALLLFLLVPDTIENLGDYLLHALAAPAPDLLFRGEVYPPARPPFYFGLVWVLEQTSFAVAVALLAGVVLGMRRRWRAEFSQAFPLAAISASFLILPVLFRSPYPLGADFALLFVTTSAPLAGAAIYRFFKPLLSRAHASPRVRYLACAAIVTAGLSVGIEVPQALFVPESYRSPLTAGLSGWSATKDMPRRQVALPLHVLKKATRSSDARLFSGGWEPYLDAYRAMGLLENLETTPDRDHATVAIRAVPPISVDFPATTPYQRRLPNSRTHVIPAPHRPAYLIDHRN